MMEKCQCIYSITNKLNGKQYIGSAINFYDRKKKHLAALRHNYHHSYKLQRDWNEELFVFSILEIVSNKEYLIPREQWWIDNSNSYYNICRIAKSSLGIKRTKETKEKLRKVQLGIKHPEWRNKLKSMAQGGKNHYGYGKKYSEQHRLAMSEGQKEMHKTGFHPRHKKIIQYSLNGKFIREWESTIQASNELGLTRTGITHCLTGRNKTAYKFIWKYEK